MAIIESKTLSNYRPNTHLADVGGEYKWISNPIGLDVKDFGASGSPARTSGSMANGSNILTGVDAASFKVGQGVFIKNGGADGNGSHLNSGLDLVEKVAAILSPTSLQISAPAIRPVTDQLVQHDDTEAIQKATDFAFFSGASRIGFGGTVRFSAGNLGTEGHYRLNKRWLPLTNSLIGVPQILPSVSGAGYINFVGDFQVPPSYNELNTTGVILDTELQGGGVKPAIISVKAFVDTVTDNFGNDFNYITGRVQSINFRLTDASTVGAVNFGNALNSFFVDLSANGHIHYKQYTALAQLFGFGFAAAQTNNMTRCVFDQTAVVGAKVCYFSGEHTQFLYALGAYAQEGLQLSEGFRENAGNLAFEHVCTWIRAKGQNKIDVSIAGEYFNTPGNPFATAANGLVIDETNALHGKIQLSQTKGNIGMVALQAEVTGCQDVKFSNTANNFAQDLGEINNAIVSRLLPVADFTANAVMKDEFFTPGDMELRKPDVLQLGANVWNYVSLVGGTARTSGNTAQTSSNGQSIAWHEGGTATRTFRIKYKIPSGGTQAICRYVDENNYLLAEFDRTTGVMRLGKRVAGVNTFIGTTFNGYTAENDWIEIKCDNTNRLSLSINGVEKMFAAGVTEFATATKYGFFSHNRSSYERAEIV